MSISPESPTINTDDSLLWIDCEFTGLSLSQGHKIIEIGAVVTDMALVELDTYQSFVKYEWEYIKSRMDINPWWHRRVTDQQRIKAGLEVAKPVQEVDSDLAQLVDTYFKGSMPPICGNSVSNDKKHIDDQMPSFASRLHYQIIDVSSLKLIAAKYRSIEYTEKVHNHFALDDIRESVDEFRFLMNSLGIVDISALGKSL